MPRLRYRPVQEDREYIIEVSEEQAKILLQSDLYSQEEKAPEAATAPRPPTRAEVAKET